MTRAFRGLQLLALTLAVGQPAVAQDVPAAEAFVCFDPVTPVTQLDLPSRYKDDSANRSDFDAEANAAVEAALQPVDDFIVALVKTTNAALEAPIKQQAEIANCALDRINAWAAANALADMKSQGAQLAVPSRIGGIAMAYAQVRALGLADQRQVKIEAWLTARMQASMAFFDTEAPPKASQNNLRAWAALAATQVGLLQNDLVLTTWAADSVKLVACTANPDGSLPNEMWRGKLALHYQIHAVGPLVSAAALLSPAFPDLWESCDGAIARAARFSIAAAQNPALAEAVAGEKQSFNASPDKLRAFEFAWLVPFLMHTPDADLQKFADQFEVLSNSKLGGKQSLLWPKPDQPKP